jgi:diguanylate cyclase (GGDEF)-like protein
LIGTQDHWRGFYDAKRPCLADLVVQNRMEDIDALYLAHDDLSGKNFGVHAETWCVMPQVGTHLYLAIDAGPIFDPQGKLIAVVETLRDMTSHKKAQTELERLANHDGLTGIYNRRGFDDKLHAEFSRSSRESLPLSLAMVDVDFFKQFNDTYGHQAGDHCLKKVADALAKSTFRPSDMAARYGGEEFAIVLPSVDEEGAKVVANRVLKAVSGLGIVHSGSVSRGVVTVSIGVATIIPSAKSSEKELIQAADEALYRAKHGGRNRVECNTIAPSDP